MVGYRCRVSKRDKLLASHAGLHLSNLQWCWHRLNSGNWRNKLKRIDRPAAALQNTVAEHCCCLQSKCCQTASHAATVTASQKINSSWFDFSPNHQKPKVGPWMVFLSMQVTKLCEQNSSGKKMTKVDLLLLWLRLHNYNNVRNTVKPTILKSWCSYPTSSNPPPIFKLDINLH